MVDDADAVEEPGGPGMGDCDGLPGGFGSDIQAEVVAVAGAKALEFMEVRLRRRSGHLSLS